MAQKELMSRVKSKIDTAENWETNNPKLLKGEVVPVVVTDSNGNITNVAFKVGDGVSNYATLPFASANAWDVFDWAKAESVEIRITDDSKYYIDFFDVGSTPNEKTIIKSVELFTVDQTYSENSKNAQSGKAIASALSSKVDKVTGKALSTNDFTTTLLNKLNGIAEGANKYVHPTHTAHSTANLYKITVDALGHVTSATAVTKADITNLGISDITVDAAMSTTSTNPVQNKVVNTALSNKQDKFADITNPGICKVTMSNSGKTYFCNNASTSGIYFDTSIRLLQGHDITNDDDLVHKKYVDTEVANNKVTVDSEMSSISTNPVQNKVVKAEIDSKALSVTDTGSGNLSISSLGYSPVTTNSVYISDFADTDTASVDGSGDDVSAQSNGSDSPSTIATADPGSNITLKSLYFKDLNVTYKIPDAVTVDTALSSSSKHPVENQVITTALAGKTDLSASGASSLINKLSTGNSTPSDTDLFISQYVGGGTTNTNYYRRPISTLNTYIKSKADKTPTSGSANLVTSGAVYTALSGKASSTHTHTINQVTSTAFNTTGSVDYISRSLVPYISGTKFYGMPAAAITVEYSRDGGATWIDYGLDDGAKMRIFDHSNNANLYLGKASTKADNNIKNMLRITVDATKSDGRYLSTDSMFTWMSSNGNTTCVTLEVASYNAPTTFRTIVDNAPINGWSGPNMSHYGMITFGGSTAGSTSPNNQFYRLTYKQTAINSNHPSALIGDIRFFGSTVWGGGKAIVNGMLKYGAPYSVRIDPDSSSGAVNFNLLGATFGNGTAADGKYSLAGGINAIVNHEGSIAYGRDLNTSAQYQAVFGKYNATSSTALFQVGNGTSTSSRKTAFNVFADGHAEVQTQGTTSNSVVIKSELDKKQDLIGTITGTDVQTLTSSQKGLIVKFTGTPQASQTFSNYYALTSDKLSTDKLIFGLGSSGVYPVGVEGGRDGDGVYIAFSNPGSLAVGLRNILDPVNDTDAANKKYVTTVTSNKLDADTDNYNIAYDTASEAIKITFKN